MRAIVFKGQGQACTPNCYHIRCQEGQTTAKSNAMPIEPPFP